MSAPILVNGEATADELKAEIERLRGVERNAREQADECRKRYYELTLWPEGSIIEMTRRVYSRSEHKYVNEPIRYKAGPINPNGQYLGLLKKDGTEGVRGIVVSQRFGAKVVEP